MSIIYNPPIMYYTNDKDYITGHKAKYLLSHPNEARELMLRSDEDLFSYIVGYMRNRPHTNEMEVKKLLREMDMFEPVEGEKIDTLLHQFLKDKKAEMTLLLKYRKALEEDTCYVEERLKEEKKEANERMKADGFIEGKEKYLILDLPLKGQQTMRWYHVAEVSKAEDFIKILEIMSACDTKKDYLLKIERINKDTPWVTGSVSYIGKDGFTENMYRFIPVKWLEKAMKDSYNQEMFDKLHIDISTNFDE